MVTHELHSQQAGARLLGDLGRAAQLERGRRDGTRGVPARVLPLPLWHTASTGLELWLTAIAYGASQVWILLTDEEAPQYRQALEEQIAVAQAILTGLGFSGEHVRLLQARDARDLAALDRDLQAPPAQGVARSAGFAIQADKRATLALALDHLMAQAPTRSGVIALPAAGSPLGAQLNLAPQRNEPVLLNEMKPYACIRCSKPFGTLKAIEAMLGKLAGHSMFQGAALERLKMCGDCRVIDLHSASNEARITDL